MKGQEAFNRSLGETVRCIRRTMDHDALAFAELLGMSTARLTEVCAGKLALSMRELDMLAEVSGLHVDNILAGEIDFAALGAHTRGNTSFMPERYSDERHKLARARSMQVICAALRVRHGERFAREILSRYQVRPEAFGQASAFISPDIPGDILQEMQNEGYSDDDLRRTGTMGFVFNAPLLAQLPKNATPKQLYTYVHEELFRLHFDRVHTNHLTRITNDGCTTVVTAREEAQEAFKSKTIGNRATCLYKQGLYMSLLANIGPRYAKVTEDSCIYTGAGHCTIHLTWH